MSDGQQAISSVNTVIFTLLNLRTASSWQRLIKITFLVTQQGRVHLFPQGWPSEFPLHLLSGDDADLTVIYSNSSLRAQLSQIS